MNNNSSPVLLFFIRINNFTFSQTHQIFFSNDYNFTTTTAVIGNHFTFESVKTSTPEFSKGFFIQRGFFV